MELALRDQVESQERNVDISAAMTPLRMEQMLHNFGLSQERYLYIGRDMFLPENGANAP